MKKITLCLILIMLTGCSLNQSNVNVGTDSVLTSENSTTSSAYIDTEKTYTNTTTANKQEVSTTTIIAQSTETAITAEILTVTTKVSINDTGSSTEKEPQYTEKVESEQAMPTIVKDKYFIVSLTPQKIYWNDIKEFNIDIGESFDILVPNSFYEVVRESDQLVIFLNEINHVSFDEEDQYNVKATINGIGNGMWYMDEFCQIIDDKLCFYEADDNISKSFYNFSQLYGTEVINEENLSDIKFTDGMTINDIDYYFEQARKRADKITQEVLDNPDTLFEMPASYLYTGNGVRFRAEINKIY